MESTNIWEYLDNIWVLAGLVLVAFTGLLKLLPIKNLGRSATERLMHKGINYLFILGFVSIMLGFAISDKSKTTPYQNEADASSSPRSPTNQDHTEVESLQVIKGNKGTAINAAGDVSVNQPLPPTPDHAPSDLPGPIDQHIEGNNGIAINAGGGVSINNLDK